MLSASSACVLVQSTDSHHLLEEHMNEFFNGRQECRKERTRHISVGSKVKTGLTVARQEEQWSK